MKIFAIGMVLAASVLAGCAGGTGGQAVSLVTTAPAEKCGAPLLPVMVNPASGATGVSTSIGSITLANVESGDVFSLGASSAPGISLGPVTTNLTAPATVTVPIPALAPATTYLVTMTAGSAPDPCGVLPVTTPVALPNVFAQLGSFTTR